MKALRNGIVGARRLSALALNALADRLRGSGCPECRRLRAKVNEQRGVANSLQTNLQRWKADALENHEAFLRMDQEARTFETMWYEAKDEAKELREIVEEQELKETLSLRTEDLVSRLDRLERESSGYGDFRSIVDNATNRLEGVRDRIGSDGKHLDLQLVYIKDIVKSLERGLRLVDGYGDKAWVPSSQIYE